MNVTTLACTLALPCLNPSGASGGIQVMLAGDTCMLVQGSDPTVTRSS